MSISTTITTTVVKTASPESEETITSFLDNHPQGALTTIDIHGRLHGSVVNAFLIDAHSYAFMTKKDTQKYTNLQANATISFVSFDPFSRTEAELEGVAYLVEDQEEASRILDVIDKAADKGRWHVSPYVTTQDDYALFMMYPRKLHMVTYWDKTRGLKAFHEWIDFEITVKD